MKLSEKLRGFERGYIHLPIGEWAEEVRQLEAENERLHKIEDAARLVVSDEGNPTDAWCLLLNALGGDE